MYSATPDRLLVLKNLIGNYDLSDVTRTVLQYLVFFQYTLEYDQYSKRKAKLVLPNTLERLMEYFNYPLIVRYQMLHELSYTNLFSSNLLWSTTTTASGRVTS